MLLLNVFADLGKVVGILCLATYYPAQLILALSISIVVYKLNKDDDQYESSTNGDDSSNNIDL